MTKNPTDHRDWTLEEVEEDPNGYLSAQATYHEERAEALERRAHEDDLERFTETFVAAGGEKRDAEAAFRAHRRERAAEAAARADSAVAEMTRRQLTERL
jgi:hypothetical protein